VDGNGGKPACPQDSTSDPDRTRGVLRRLRSHAQGKRLLAALGRLPVVCYGDVPEGILRTDGVALLEAKHPVSANAARLGHLLHHLVHGLPFDEKIASASTIAREALVKRALLSERAAYDLENDLRQGFRLPHLAFEDTSDGYMQRCRELRKEPASPSAM
jgi:hypothetical protein